MEPLSTLAGIFAIFLTAQSTCAAPTSPRTTAKIVKKMPPEARQASILWDYWYTVLVNKTIRYSYYHEKVRRTEGRIHYQFNSWKAEEGFLNEESLGAFAKDTPFLEPIFFNFRSVYRATETTIDGTLQPDNTLAIKVKRNSSEMPVMRKLFPPKTLLAGYFPVWFRLRLPLMKEGQSIGFRAVAEDNVDLGFSPFAGLVRLEKPDSFCLNNRAKRLTVNYRDIRSTWYLDANGAPIRIEMPGIKTVVERTSEQLARKFLE